MKQTVEVISSNRPFIIDDSKIDAFLEVIKNNKGAKQKLLAMSRENRKNRMNKR